MNTNTSGIENTDREKFSRTVWQRDRGDRQNYRNGKRFFRCVCPKCAEEHNIYMLWSGRGMPRKYCSNCKPLIAGYNDTSIYEVLIDSPNNTSNKNGKRFYRERS